MAYSSVTYTGDGLQTIFPVPFSYLSRNYLSVTLDGVQCPFIPVIGGSIQIEPAPILGVIIQINRITPVVVPVVDFTASPTLTGDNLNTVNLHLLHAIQEIHDQCSVLAKAAFSTWTLPDVSTVSGDPFRPPDYLYPVTISMYSPLDSGVRLLWTPVPGATEYYVRYGTAPSALSVITPSRPLTSIDIYGLVPGAVYYFQVVATGPSGTSYSRQVACSPIMGTGMIGPSGLSLTPGPMAVSLSWVTSHTPNATSYVIEYSTSPAMTTPQSVNVGNVSSRTIMSLSTGVTYWFRIGAVYGVSGTVWTSPYPAIPT